MTYLYSADVQTEDPRTQIRRRIQQRRCLVCGARKLPNPGSYFCAHCFPDWRYCGLCERLRTAEAHGKDSRCKGCANDRATAAYYAHYRDANVYRIRLRQIASRTATRGDQIFEQMRRRIALAELVRQTPGWSWPKRAAVFGGNPTQLAYRYRWQQSDQLCDVDAADRARDAHWRTRL